MNNLQGLKFHVMEKKGECKHCNQPIERGCNSVLLGSYNNVYRYCAKCFLISVENWINVDILGFIEMVNYED